ncbi:MAG: hypothetical protein A2284_12500 [Deltaproteobacteria bacterium RIFOXYA12_FULL_61_11]|nr:MAG: hypothetical protein A2284_12500 [Deltaproteobacteria bacterium RIFOXYA12_FULL_61_11]
MDAPSDTARPGLLHALGYLLYRLLVGCFVWLHQIRYFGQGRSSSPARIEVAGVALQFAREDASTSAWVQHRLGAGRSHEPALTALLPLLLREAELFLDLGAHLGYFTCLAARLLPRGAVLAVEMDAQLAAGLRKNLLLNGLDTVEVHEVALGASTGRVKYRRLAGSANPCSSIVPLAPQNRFGRVVEVPLTTLDALLATRAPRAMVCKLDVEGAESLVLAGAETVLRVWKPVLVVELHPLFAPPGDDPLALLTAKGYEVFKLEQGSRGPLLFPWQMGKAYKNRTLLLACTELPPVLRSFRV